MCGVLFFVLFFFYVRRSRVTTENLLPLPWTGRSRLPLHPLICIRFEFLIMDSSRCLLLSLTKHSLMMRLWQMTLGKITWASIIVFFSVFYQIDPPTLISVLFFPFIIKLGITPLPGLFSTQQLHTDVETLSFIVFGGSPSALRCERECFIRRL